VLFTDDTSALISANNLDELQTKLLHTLTYMSECFTANELKLYIDKTNLMHFKLTFSASSACQTSYCEANVKQAVHMKFLVLHLDNHMNWKTCIDKKISELSRACYVIRFVYFLNDVSTSKTVMPTSAH
jgi:hypothetical protein